MRNRIYTLLYIIGLSFFICSCQKQLVYSRFEHTDVEGWERNDTLSFDIPIPRASIYQLNINLRATMAYPYKDVCLVMERSSLSKSFHRKDTVRCKIFSDSGRLIGKNGISNTKLRYHVANIDSRHVDTLHITLHHCMRRELLPGLTEVGVELTQ